MGFIKDVAGAALSPVGAAMGLFNKKKPAPVAPPPMMLSSTPSTRAPTSMIGASRGGY